MRSAAASWMHWWCTEDILSERFWQNNMEVFIRATEPILKYGPEDIILDIGSGPGYLAGFLKDRVKEIHCVEISDRYVHVLRNKFKQYPHVVPYTLDAARYTDLSFLEQKKFSIIVCQSVVQYYDCIGDIERLIREVGRLAMPGARFLISDIPITSNKWAYWTGFLKIPFKKPSLLVDTSRILTRLYLSETGKTYRALGLLSLSEIQLKQLIGKLNLNAEILSTKLTSNENRCIC